jgi:hypothetical protein
MSTYKRVNGDYTIQTLGANTITFAGNVANAVTVVVDGNFTVTGNATLIGNISGDKLFNGTTSIEIPTASGNANITVGSVSNVAVFTTTGANISGTLSVSGNITGANINASSNVSAAGNVTGSNLVTGGSVTAVGAVTGGSITTAGIITATGNITTGGYFIGDGGFLSNTIASTQLTSGSTTIAVSVPNGNIFATVNSVGNVLVISSTGISVTGNLTVNGAVTSTSASVVSSATITPTAGSTNQYNVTALAADASIAIPSGTPIDGQPLTIRVLDDGTPRALTWTTGAGGYRVVGVTLPTTTVANKTVYIGCIYNSAAGFWDVVTVTQQL